MRFKTLLLLVMLTIAGNGQVRAQDDCTYTLALDYDFRTFANPMRGGSGGIARPGETYEVLRIGQFSGLTYYELQIGENNTGWVERLTRGSLNGDCESGIFNEYTADDFPDVCEFRMDEDIVRFDDPNLTEATSQDGTRLRIFGSTETLSTRPLTMRNAMSGFVYSGHAGPIRGYIATHDVELINCPEIEYTSPVNATTLQAAQMWSMPDVTEGQVRAQIPAESVLNVLAGPTIGVTGPDNEWFLLRHPDFGTGWMQSSQIELDGEFPFSPVGFGITLNNARLWSAPDVRRGQYIGNIGEGNEIILVLGPVNGMIHLEDELFDDWYYVTSFTQGGWLWEGRIRPMVE